jgi:hypothetical protein
LRMRREEKPTRIHSLITYLAPTQPRATH